MRRRLKIGIVYSGGLGNCAYQIGFTNALLQFVEREEIQLISSSSAGIFSAYALSANKLEWVEQMYRRVDISKKTELLWQVFAKGLLSKYLDALLDVNDRLEIPLCFPVCYIPLYSVRYYWLCGKYNTAWKRYLMAAINYPFLRIVPSYLRGRFAIDGGAADNIPLYPILQKSRPVCEQSELDLIFVLHFDSHYDWRKQFKPNCPVLDLDLSISNHFEKAHYDYSGDTIGEKIGFGYEYGEKICTRLFAGDCSKQHFQKVIDEIFVEEYTLRQRNLSLDRFFTLLNCIGKLMRNDAHCTEKLY